MMDRQVKIKYGIIAGIFLVTLILWATALKACMYPVLAGYSRRLLAIYCVLSLGFIFFCFGLAVYLVRKGTIRMERLFLCCVLAAGIIYMFIMPPFTAPDEFAHYATAYRWSNVMMLREDTDENGNVYMRAEDAEAVGNDAAFLNSKENYMRVMESFLKPCQDQEITVFEYKLVSSGPIPYLAQALGITIGRLLGAGWVLTIFLGRLMNLALFSVCGFFAVKWIPFGKKILFAISMLPMTLEMVSSLSYDAATLGLSMLFIALCLKYAFVSEKIGARQVAALAVVLALLAPCKIVYALLAGLCFLIPRKKFGSGKFYAASAAIVFLAMAASLLINSRAAIGGYVTAGGENYISWADAPGYTLGALLKRPLWFLFLLINTLRHYGGFYLTHIVGYELGWRNICIGEIAVAAFWIYLLASSLVTEKEPLLLDKRKKLWILLICGGTAFLVALSMLLGWTPAHYTFIEGVQGRYFLPILPLLLLTLQNRRLVWKQDMTRVIVFCGAFLNIFVIQKIVEVALTAAA